ncbi:MAG: hypothetical protein A2Z16_15915 [Chloroflexi bacterium RBG_16_54_18]|nr:MAG: hypothetical protein A2Z16_15915 [Chloroflexi bacterium RBG_16_54_18]
MEDLSGKQLGQYKLDRRLGRGGMASVYKAYQPGTDRHVAIKILPRDDMGDPNFLNRFRQEARIIANLEHPHILPVYDYGEANGYTFLVMRLVEGGTLADLLRGRPLPLERIGKTISQLAEALDYAHSRGVVHRDIKPGNILVDANGRCLLSDFGIAKMAVSSPQYTVTGSFVGTPQYASPEQALGKDLDGRSDIYSLGVILYEMATGKVPYEADTPMGLVIKHVNEPLPAPSSVNPSLPPALESVIARSLAKDRRDRFQTAGEMASALSAAIVQGLQPTGQQTVFEPISTYIERLPTPIPLAHAPSEPRLPTFEGTQPRRRLPAWIWAVGGTGALLFCTALILVASLGSRLFPLALMDKTPSATLLQPVSLVEPTSTPTPTRMSPTPIPPAGSDTIFLEYILDASGSMLELLQGQTKLSIAQAVLSERVSALPPDVHVGLRVYGHRVPYQQEEQSCKDIELVVPIQVGGANPILDWLASMQAQGMTPMSEAIRLAAEDFTFTPANTNSIILISDGLETCGDDPSDVARYLQELGIDFTIHVIGLGVDDETREQLKRLADTGKGVYHDANSEEDLQKALADLNTLVIQTALEKPVLPTEAPTPTPLPEPNFDAASEGQLQASSTYPGYSPEMARDGDLATSWFSAGSKVDGSTSVFRWTGIQDDWIASITVISNREHIVPDYRTGFGFGLVTIQVLDASGTVVYEETAELPGTPDPDVTFKPGVTGREVVLTFTGHESPDCGGFAELQIGVVR